MSSCSAHYPVAREVQNRAQTKRNLSHVVRALSLAVANRWEKVVASCPLVVKYVAEHAPYLRWCAEIRRLIDCLRLFLSHDLISIYTRRCTANAAAGVISATIRLPNELFNPIVLWIAIQIAEGIVETDVDTSESLTIRHMYLALLNALRVKWGNDSERLIIANPGPQGSKSTGMNAPPGLSIQSAPFRQL